jgi:hypothetical protein
MKYFFCLVFSCFTTVFFCQKITPISESIQKPSIVKTLTEPAPVVVVKRDDHVATIKMDYNEHGGWGAHLWTVGNDGLDAIGYRVQWWPDDAVLASLDNSLGCASDNSTGSTTPITKDAPKMLVTANNVAQIQPIANNKLYHVKVEKLNSFGQVCSPPTIVTFNGGDPTRVNNLRANFTFFDDFNWQEGAPDELKWNNAIGPQTDPRFNLFFINSQCHVHTLNGTRNDGAGDKSQSAQLARKPMLIENSVRRNISFDMDGIFSGRSVWYLDLNPVQTELTGHLSFFDSDGDQGLPADVLRLKAVGHEISVNLINSQGQSLKIASAYLPDFGRATAPNIRRTFLVNVGVDGITIKVDSNQVLNASFPPGAFKPGVYHLLWSAVGYNTSKDDVPYYVVHWDNFGFDGPDVSTHVTHNYVTRILGSDLQKANKYNNEFPVFKITVPDDIRPVAPAIKNEIWLVFSYQKNDFSTFHISQDDSLLFNGVKYTLPPGQNNTHPLVPELVDYSGSTITNRVKLGEVMQGAASPVIIGENVIQFFASNTGIMNLHLEVLCPKNNPMPPYTPPYHIHHLVHHDDLPNVGPAARIVFVDDKEYDHIENEMLKGPTVSGSIPIEVLVGNANWAGWAPQWLHMPALSGDIFSMGSTPGVKQVNLYLRKKGEGNHYGHLIGTIKTNHDAPAPQVRYEFTFDTRQFPNGDYQLFTQAISDKDVKSHPSYSGWAFLWDAEEASGAYQPIHIKIQNQIGYTFTGTTDKMWTTNSSWLGGAMPPQNYSGSILIDADCEIPSSYDLQLSPSGYLIVNEGRVLRVK